MIAEMLGNVGPDTVQLGSSTVTLLQCLATATVRLSKLCMGRFTAEPTQIQGGKQCYRMS